MDAIRLSRAVREILHAVGEDPAREGLRHTPARVARAYAELFAGLREDPSIHLSRTFRHDSEGLVSLGGVEFTSLCEHHLLPVFGTAYVAYLPSKKRVVGLSKIARTIEVFARRPQLQERMTAQIADAIMDHLEPQGVVVVVDGEHMCLRMRGAKKTGAIMRTLASRGVFERNEGRRREVLTLMGVDRRPGSAVASLVSSESRVSPQSAAGSTIGTGQAARGEANPHVDGRAALPLAPAGFSTCEPSRE